MGDKMWQSTSRIILYLLISILSKRSENFELKPKFKLNIPVHGKPNRYDNLMSTTHNSEQNFSPMKLVGNNQMVLVYLWNKGLVVIYGEGGGGGKNFIAR